MDCFNFRSVLESEMQQQTGCDSGYSLVRGGEGTSRLSSNSSPPVQQLNSKYLETQLFETPHGELSRKSSTSTNSGSTSMGSWMDFPQILNLDDGRLSPHGQPAQQTFAASMDHLHQRFSSGLPTSRHIMAAHKQTENNSSFVSYHNRHQQQMQQQIVPSHIQPNIYLNQEHLNMNGADIQDNINVFVVSLIALRFLC